MVNYKRCSGSVKGSVFSFIKYENIVHTDLSKSRGSSRLINEVVNTINGHITDLRCRAVITVNYTDNMSSVSSK